MLRLLPVCLLVLIGFAIDAPALSLQLDYTYDTSSFFSGANIARRTTLQAAASLLSSRLTDDLTGIAPTGSNSWTAVFPNPATGATVDLSNLTVPADTVIVFVGARELGATTLGIGGPGGYAGSGSQSWLNTLAGRGEAGALLTTPTDFGPWGGALTFDISANWYFDSDVSKMEAVGAKDDFFSVAMHELGHLLGIGLAGSWTARKSGSNFTGAYAKAAHGGMVPLDSSGGHWANGVSGHLESTGALQEAAMDPSLFVGTRKYFTDLDWAGLRDVGWQVTTIPEPTSSVLALGGAAWILGMRQRRPASAV